MAYRCKIYDTRPDICRNYPTRDNSFLLKDCSYKFHRFKGPLGTCNQCGKCCFFHTDIFNLGKDFVKGDPCKYLEKICKNMNEPDEYLNYINNDLVKFIGYNIDLKKNKDTEGLRLWNELDKKMYKNKKVNQTKIEKLLLDVPLYFLLSFLGYASYKEDLSLPL